MEKTSDDLVVEAREWSMNKINSDIPMENVKAIYEEFQEWIDIDKDDEDLEILSLEPLDEESVSVVGGGNAGVFTALYFGWYGHDRSIKTFRR